MRAMWNATTQRWTAVPIVVAAIFVLTDTYTEIASPVLVAYTVGLWLGAAFGRPGNGAAVDAPKGATTRGAHE